MSFKSSSLRANGPHEERQYSISSHGLETTGASRCDSPPRNSLRDLSFFEAFSAMSVKPALCSDKAPDRQVAKLHQRGDPNLK